MTDFAGDTIPITRCGPRREKPGFGCPECGTALDLDGEEALKTLASGYGLKCCGYTPTDEEAVRWVRAARLLAAGSSAH